MPKSVAGTPPALSYARDPIAGFLTHKVGFTPATFGIFILVADLVVDLWLGWHFQNFFSSGPTPGLLQDTAALWTDFVVNPLLCGVYLWTSRWSADLFRGLDEAKVLHDNTLIEKSEARREQLFRSRRVFVLVLVLALANTVSQVGSYRGWLPWRTIEGYLYLLNGIMSFYRAPFWFITTYAFLYTAYNAIVSILCINRLFGGQKVKLQLMHPDGCGGLGSLGEYASMGVILIIPIGVLTSAALLATTLQNTLAVAYPVWILLLVYLTLAPILLILPLYSAHRAMVRTRDAELQIFFEAYNCEFGIVRANLAQRLVAPTPNGERSVENQASLEAQPTPGRLDEIKKLYQIVETDFPSWPLNFRILRRYSAAVLSPLVPALLSILIDVGAQILTRIVP